MSTEDPQLPAPSGPATPRRRLEQALFALVFGAGAALAVLGALGGEEAGGARSVSAESAGDPAPVPGPTPTFPVGVPEILEEVIDELPPEILEETVIIGRAESMGTPVGCTAELFFVWHVDTDIPGRPMAVIQVKGPAVGGRYERPMVGGDVELRLDVPLGSANDAWTANVLSIDGRPAFPTPLEVTFDLPEC